ncbi:MAG: hypothetical protein OEW97_09160, partial [Gammaproteobacteria bacterium]|nr:hypothetical protein [Gammaproteobacteria bacterium]
MTDANKKDDKATENDVENKAEESKSSKKPNVIEKLKAMGVMSGSKKKPGNSNTAEQNTFP